MCEQCENLQKQIDQYNRILHYGFDPLTEERLKAAISELEKRKAALHRGRLSCWSLQHAANLRGHARYTFVGEADSVDARATFEHAIVTNADCSELEHLAMVPTRKTRTGC